MQLQVLLLVVCVLGVNWGISRADCPPAEDIYPCVCRMAPYILVCEKIHDVEQLRNVAENLEGSPFNGFRELWIINSSLQYLPTGLLETVKTKELAMENVTLQTLFREPPTSLKMFQIIRFKNVKLLRGIVWQVFSKMENLRIIHIDGIPVNTLGKDFNQNVPYTLRELALWNTKTKKLEIGAFEGFKDLVKLDIYNGRIQELHRGSFPVPFNVDTIFLINNRIKVIPDDLFTNMPNLNDLVLENNQISAVPESAFGGRFNQFERFNIKDNPLKCNCALRWIVIHKPKWFEGICAAPKVMHGRNINSLYWESFVC